MTLGQLPRRLAIRKYTADAILFRENQSNKKDILMIAAFQVGMQRSHIFGPLYKFLPGPLGDVWTLCLLASCSNSFLGTWQMLMR